MLKVYRYSIGLLFLIFISVPRTVYASGPQANSRQQIASVHLPRQDIIIGNATQETAELILGDSPSLPSLLPAVELLDVNGEGDASATGID